MSKEGGRGLQGGQGPPVMESFGGQGRECGLYCEVERKGRPLEGFVPRRTHSGARDVAQLVHES